MLKSIFGSWIYLVWYLCHLVILGILTEGGIVPMYIMLLIIAFLPIPESLWRWVSGVRPLRLMSEKERLIPLYEEVYNAYIEKEEKISHTRKVKLYIQESMNINAFAFGRETLVLTKGSIDLLNDNDIKGLMAHELAHFHNYDTTGALFAYIANLPFTFMMRKLRQIDSKLGNGFVRFVFSVIFAYFRFFEFVGDLILMYHTRSQEYNADTLALKWGYGEELAGVLIQIYQISLEKPKSIGDMIRSTHPPITKRIEQLESF